VAPQPPPPQQLAGVGFTGQGLFEGTHYRRLPASHEPQFAWMFEGITEEILGDYGCRVVAPLGSSWTVPMRTLARRTMQRFWPSRKTRRPR